METCTIETGLLKKKPCGQTAVTKCANCQQDLCAKHAGSTMSGGKKTMLCPERATAGKDQRKTVGRVEAPPAAAPQAKNRAEAPNPAARPKPAPNAARPVKPAAVPIADKDSGL